MTRFYYFLLLDTRRRFNVDTKSYDVVRRRIDVETTSCVYWVIAWNGFPKRIGDDIINKKLKGLNVNNIKNTANNDFETIWIKIPYLSGKGDQLLKSLKTKLKHHLTTEVKFRIIHYTQKLSFYTNMKDQIPKLMKSYVVYQFD